MQVSFLWTDPASPTFQEDPAVSRRRIVIAEVLLFMVGCEGDLGFLLNGATFFIMYPFLEDGYSNDS